MSKNPLLSGCTIHHVALRTSDLSRSIAFYTQGLGFQLIAQWEEGTQQIAMVDTGGGTIVELFHGGQNHARIDEMQIGAMFHLAFWVDDVDYAFSCAVQQGATEKIAPRDVTLPAVPAPMHVRNCFVYGPDGETLEFIHLN